ncbi:MAG: hypothetical protein AAF740_11405 [Bacteroidota bacterium]
MGLAPSKEEKKWLNHLHRESWQMELLIMGFTIVLLAGVPNELEELKSSLSVYAENDMTGQIGDNALTFLKVITYVLLLNLLVDIVLRGIWIGYVGLSSVYPEGVNYNKLPYQNWYIKRFRHSFLSPTASIVRLDQICSQIFAFTFLIIFYLISFLLFLLYFIPMALLINYFDENGPNFLLAAVITFLVLFFFGGVLYFFDFLTGGILKRLRFMGKFYRILYLFYGWVTLAFLYRNIYYSILSNANKWVFKGILLGYIFIPIAISEALPESEHQFFYSNVDKLRFANNYYDSRLQKNYVIGRGTLGEEVVSGDFLRLFVRYYGADDNLYEEICPEFKDIAKGDSVTIMGKCEGLASNDITKSQYAAKCLSAAHQVWIDSLQQETDFMFYTHPNAGEKGILTYLDVSSLSRGKHWLLIKKVRSKRKNDKDYPFQDFMYVPFWKE